MMTAELTLDDTYNARMIDLKIGESERYKMINNLMVRRMFCMALGEFLRDVKGMAASANGRRSYVYIVTDTDIDNLAKIIYDGIEGVVK